MGIDANLGTSANMMYGFDTNWLTEKKGNNALFPVLEKPMREIGEVVDFERGEWGFPTVSLHHDAISLFDTLLPYTFTEPVNGLTEVAFSPGSLMLGHDSRSNDLKILSQTFGINFATEGMGYALVVIKRTDGILVHPSVQLDTLIHPNPIRIPDEYGVSKTFMKTMSKFKRVKPVEIDDISDIITVDEANKYLMAMEKTGTHFVSRITAGDAIFQIFAMPKEKIEQVMKIYEKRKEMLEGPNAVLFRQYTTSIGGSFGYVAEYSGIMSLSGDAWVRESVYAGKWRDEVYAECDSIFTLFAKNSDISLGVLNGAARGFTGLCTELTSLTLLLEYGRKNVWKRILQAGLAQKFGNTVKQRFEEHCPMDLSMYFQEDDIPGFLSTIATPRINAYKTMLDISEMTFVAAETVKESTFYGNYIFCGKEETVDIPGNDVMLVGQLCAFEKRSNEGYKKIPVIRLTDKAYGSAFFSFARFYGALIVANASNDNYYVIADGLRYDFCNGEAASGGRQYVKALEDIRKPPINPLRMKASLQCSLGFNECAMYTVSPETNPEYMMFIREGLEWIANSISAETDDRELLEIRVRALDLSRMVNDGTYGPYVPVLKAEDYEKQTDKVLSCVKEIDDMLKEFALKIEMRKMTERIIDVGQALNENIITSGKLLADYINAGIERQKKLSKHYDDVVAQMELKKQAQITASDKLLLELNVEKSKLDETIGLYKQAVEDWQTRESVKFAIDICSGIFTLGLSILVPASSIKQVESLGRTAQYIQKFINAINSANKLYDDVNRSTSSLQNAQKILDELSDTLLADVGWDEMVIDVDEILAQSVSDQNVVNAKNKLVAAFKRYVLKGRSYTSALLAVQQIGRDIYSNQLQKAMIDDDVKKLSALNTALSPKQVKDLDVDNINLLGLTGILSMMRYRMIGLLAKSFYMQDQSLRYAWMQKPTQINSFDMVGIQSALVNQGFSTVEAKTKLGRYPSLTTQPIEIKVEIPAHQLADGGVFRFELMPDICELDRYVHTRIVSVVARIDEGIARTDSGEYIVNLSYVGQPFYDRDMDRTALVFNTPGRTAYYDYVLQGNKPKFVDGCKGWSEDVNMVTPFSAWEISLPKNATNKGIAFAGLTVTATLTFVLQTRMMDVPDTLFTVKPAIDTILENMTGKTVLNGWDVVFNMDLVEINKVMRLQYEDMKANPEFGDIITADVEIAGADLGIIKVFVIYLFNLQYGYPDLQFATNSGINTKLQMQINNGSLQEGTLYVAPRSEEGRKKLVALAIVGDIDPSLIKEEVRDKKEVLTLRVLSEKKSFKSGKLDAIIPIEMVKGLVDGKQNILSVVLDMGVGTFQAKFIEITLDEQVIIALGDAIKSYFSNKSVKFIINSLDISKVSIIDDLKPNEFRFKTLKTQQETELLQLFITTNRRTLSTSRPDYININEPIPLGSGCSLMVSSQIVFESILPQSIQEGWVIKGCAPSATKQGDSWKGEFTTANVKASVDLSSLSHFTYYKPKYWPGIRHRYTYAPKGGNPVSWSLSGMTINVHNNGRLKIYVNSSRALTYVRTDKKTQGSDVTYKYKEYNTGFALTVDGTVGMSVTGSGREQSIKAYMVGSTVAVNARISGGGECGADDIDAKINSAVKDVLPSQVTTEINKIQFNEVSIFALKNLLFPVNNYIKMNSVYVPGDLIIIGEFITLK